MEEPIPPGAHQVFCVKFQREMEGLDEVPFDGHPLGQKIYDNVSKQAWKMWVDRMKMIMNEYRLNLGTREAQEFLIQQMDALLLWRRRGPAAGLRPARLDALKVSSTPWRTGKGGAGTRPHFRFQYAQERASKIPGGACSSASLNSRWPARPSSARRSSTVP